MLHAISYYCKCNCCEIISYGHRCCLHNGTYNVRRINTVKIISNPTHSLCKFTLTWLVSLGKLNPLLSRRQLRYNVLCCCQKYINTTKSVRKFINSLKPRFLIFQCKLLVLFDLTARLVTRSWYSENRSSRSSGIDLYKQKMVVGVLSSFIASLSSFSNFTASSYLPCSTKWPVEYLKRLDLFLIFL